MFTEMRHQHREGRERLALFAVLLLCFIVLAIFAIAMARGFAYQQVCGLGGDRCQVHTTTTMKGG
jgi:hypothetical protein